LVATLQVRFERVCSLIRPVVISSDIIFSVVYDTFVCFCCIIE